MSTPQPTDRRRLLRHLLVVLLVVVFAYLVAVTVSLVIGDQQKGSDLERLGGTRVTLSPQTLDGAPLPAEETTRAEKVLGARLKAAGIRNAETAVDGDTVVVSLPGEDPDLPADLGARKQLLVRPVLESLPVAPAEDRSAPAPAPTDKTLAERVRTAQKTRQSDNQLIQVQALHAQTDRCGQDDPLAGYDDPALPLVTCSTDGTTAYLLGPAILDNDQIERAAADVNSHSGTNLVDLVLTADGKSTWAKFTAENVGTAAAFTQDTAVLSAPLIQEAIPAGRTQISGNFSPEDARELAAAISQGPLPSAFAVTDTEKVAPQPSSSNFGSPEFGLIAGGFVVMVALIGGLVFLMARERS
ncbi:hypothetical protein [Mycobacterium sp. 1274756.6]|uniref:SecDF P1 head subdomain-containing protein n=1 Tax=Mycobacterium sp. 1274756.6 TaxID=1834076 RepID=UPI0007FBF024|nr:hypothetical protein [Mycobacterium sp. 1274756.6]OBJ68263.1 hypothetical protein A5643_14060 [Mycobacterium sp. 1274756.6]